MRPSPRKVPQKEPPPISPLRLALAGTALFACFSFLPLIRSNSRLAASFWGATGALVLFIFIVRRAAAGRMLSYEFLPRPVHYVQLMMHSSIYLYWGWYWRERIPLRPTDTGADCLCIRVRHAVVLVAAR
jgi:hypothetical protein